MALVLGNVGCGPLLASVYAACENLLFSILRIFPVLSARGFPGNVLLTTSVVNTYARHGDRFAHSVGATDAP